MTLVKKCPNCKNEERLVIKVEKVEAIGKEPYSVFCVFCNDCGYYGTWSTSPLGAVKKWNEVKCLKHTE